MMETAPLTESMVKDAAPNLPWMQSSYAADLNLCITNGIWRVGQTTLNRPSNMQYGVLRCTLIERDILLQELFELAASGRTWNRSSNGFTGQKKEITASWFLHTPTKVT